MKIKKMIYLLTIVIVSCGIILGCRGEERLIPESKERKNREEIPKTLKAMEQKVHSIIGNLESIEELIKIKPEDIEPPKTQSEKQEKPKGEEPEPQSGDQSSQQAVVQQPSIEQEQQKKQMQKQAQVLEKWQKSEEDIKSLHESWNAYELNALKDGGDQGRIDKMETALSSLTSGIEEKNKEKALVAANDVILSLSDFMGLYKGNVDGTLAKIEYIARQSYMDSKEGDWEAATEKIEDKNSLIDALRQGADIKEKQEKLIDKLNLSIEDLKIAIEQKDLSLVEIKRDIVVKNIEILKNEL
ncbi:hypothetical protein [Garciella nitratireducens]|uniref:hypothetical protein n=1 Tax=Garciella nitratireducens TaxID=218205 RepID=UPI000DEBE7E5|nr:hypothetical protein [Garciella nitratireducens]RBP40638.1 hypothetical protein DFR81_11232 [Garciella nitratireducens]